ncbi:MULTISPECIES: hypothetical protein [Roseobacteraceae]|jgi:protein-S-isoprenylcysteine O-methyltransferase Ste14|uniref:Uncharacterized protein n=1 Tax=Pseudosulfitobacter pseudonitzschiae TaxID=1402135 RepID=A0A221JYJ8_9RHOB|nr:MULTISPECIES: hypothetical protein [Roseobacteraceae]ASM71804.1 hypothetical protein SULPSESMR1_00976 [Pseudosulfitobacter pseudonitzschiae]
MIEQTSFPIFDLLIWAGAAISLVGLLGLVWCIIRVTRAKRAKLDDEAMRAVLKSVVPMNLGALFVSAFGLMLVMLGIFLG